MKFPSFVSSSSPQIPAGLGVWLGEILAPSVPEEVIDTDTKPSNPVDWTEHLLRVCMCVCVFERVGCC